LPSCIFSVVRISQSMLTIPFALLVRLPAVGTTGGHLRVFRFSRATAQTTRSTAGRQCCRFQRTLTPDTREHSTCSTFLQVWCAALPRPTKAIPLSPAPRRRRDARRGRRPAPSADHG